MKKKITALFLSLCLIFSVNVFAAERDVKIIINGKELVTDVAPQLVKGRTMLPMRAIFEKLGAKVSWMETDRLIFATKGSKLIVMKIDDFNMSIQQTGSNENKIVELDVAPFITNGRALVPVRAVAEALDAKVEWIDETSTVIINVVETT